MYYIYLRACWSMVPVKDQYIHYEKAGDQFTGWSVTAIPYLTKEFAILPPHWDFKDSNEEGTEEKVDQLLSNNIVRENDVSGSTFIVLLFLFASFCYHYENLDRNIQEKKVWGDLQFSLLQRDQENFENTQSYNSHGRRLPFHPFPQVFHPISWWWRKLKWRRRRLKSKHAL